MKRKFECKDCHHKFAADDKNIVKCPHCGSDNVDFASIHIPYKLIGITILIVLVIILLTQIDYKSIFSHSEEHGEEVTDTAQVQEDIIQEELNHEIQKLGIIIPPTIEGVSKMELDENCNYNVTIKIGHAPEGGYSVHITDVKTNQVIAESNNGIFKGIPFSKNGGKYYAQIVSSSTNEALSEKTEITGFVEVKPIPRALTKAELQELINKQDKSLLGHDNEYLSPVYQIKYKDLPKDLDYLPDNLADVFEMLDFGSWTSVEVVSLEYDETHHISSITLKVKQ